VLWLLPHPAEKLAACMNRQCSAFVVKRKLLFGYPLCLKRVTGHSHSQSGQAKFRYSGYGGLPLDGITLAN
jgi:hypothetical protein